MNNNGKTVKKMKQSSMEKKVMIIGIDDGYNATKDSKGFTFDAGVTIDNYESSITGNRNIIEFNGVRYLYGGEAPSMIPDKSINTDMLIHTLACIAEEAERKKYPEKFDVVLGMGMPLKYYANEEKRTAYINYFTKQYNHCIFKHNDRQYEINFSFVKCYPQAYAVYQVNKGKRKLDETEYTIIDIGGNTVDCFGVINGRIKPQSINTFEHGINHLVDTIDSVLRPDIRISKESIKKCIQGEKIIHGRAKDIMDVCKKHTDKYVAELLAFFRAHYDLMIPVIWIGGGYKFLSFREEFKDSQLIFTMDNMIFDEFANAAAFEALVAGHYNKSLKEV